MRYATKYQIAPGGPAPDFILDWGYFSSWDDLIGAWNDPDQATYTKTELSDYVASIVVTGTDENWDIYEMNEAQKRAYSDFWYETKINI